MLFDSSIYTVDIKDKSANILIRISDQDYLPGAGQCSGLSIIIF